MPSILPKFVRRLRAIANPRAIDREMDAEMQTHIAFETAHLERSAGLNRDEAYRQALMKFGGLDRFAEEHRDARGIRWLTDFAQDFRFAVRTLFRSPAFTTSAVVVLALGVGASTAMFSAVNAVVLARLPHPNDEQLVRIFEQNSPTNRWTLSAVDVQAIEQFSHSFSAVGAVRFRETGVATQRATQRYQVAYANAGFLKSLAVPLAAGRLLAEDDERVESPASVVLGFRYAVQQFGSANTALNQTVTVDGLPHRVVGVLQWDNSHLPYLRAELWPVMRRVMPTRRGPFGIMSIARLKPGVTLESARKDLDAISVRIFPDWQAGFQDKVARLTPYSLRETVIGNSKRPLALFGGAVAMVLLIAVSNVASLSIVRNLRRWREVSVRTMLGASRARLVQLMLVESTVVSLLGGALGTAFGWLGLHAFQRFATGIPRLATAVLDARSVGVALSVSIASGLVIGIIPALRLLALSKDDTLRDGTRAIGDGAGSNRLRSAFVAAEFALALPVLAAGALLLTSLLRLQRVNPGFDVSGVHAVRVSVPSTTYTSNTDIAKFWQRLSSNVQLIPGVVAAGLGSALPPDDQGNNNDNFDLVDTPVAPGAAQPTVTWPVVNNEFFATLHVPLLEGRLFTFADSANGAPVIVVTSSWAKHYFHDRTAIGRELIQGGCTTCPHTVIVGVVGDITLDQLNAPGEAVFSPLSSASPVQLNVFVKASGTSPQLAERVREAVHRADPAAAMATMSTMQDGMYESMAQPRHWATILLTFAAAALLMAAVGVFGLLSYAVQMRRREIGVRMALGASPGSVVRNIVAGGMRYAGVGAMCGIALTVVASRWVGSMLYGVSAFDPSILAMVTSALLAVALVASWLPARRAAMIAPVEAMRPE